MHSPCTQLRMSSQRRVCNILRLLLWEDVAITSWERIFVSLLCNMSLRRIRFHCATKSHLVFAVFSVLQFSFRDDRDDAPAAALTLHFAAFFSLASASLAEALIFVPAGAAPRIQWLKNLG